MKREQLFYSFWLSSAAVVLFARAAGADTVQVSAVKLVNTASGLEVQLQTPQGTTPQILTSQRDRTFVVDIIATQLKIAQGTYKALLPADGITSVNVQPWNGNNIRITVTGTTGVPTGQVVRKGDGIVLSLQPAAVVSEPFGKTGAALWVQRLMRKSPATRTNASTTPAQLPVGDKKPLPTSITNVITESTNSAVAVWMSQKGGELNEVSATTPVTPKIVIRSSNAPFSWLTSSFRENKNTAVATPSLNVTPSAATTTAPAAVSTAVAEPTTAKASTVPTPTATASDETTPVPTTAKASTVPTPTPAPVSAATENNSTDTRSNVTVADSSSNRPTTNKVTVPDYLNPNPNPLQFPTKPEEVRERGTQPITLTQALELARQNNRQLQVSILTLERDRAALREAQAALLPTLSLNAGLQRQESPRQLPGSLGQPPTIEQSAATTLSGGASFDYTLSSSGGRTAAIQSAEERVRNSELEIERQTEEIRQTVSTNYYNLQQADEQVRISLSAVTNAQASLRDALALERAGVGTQFDVLQAQVQVARRVQDLTNARSQQRIAQRRLVSDLSLAQTVNISAADPVQLAGLWDRTLEESIVQAFSNRAELQQQLIQRNVGELQRRQALSQLGPQISFNASYNLQDQFSDRINVQDNFSLGLSARLNLFDGGAARAQAAQAQRTKEIAETQFAESRNQIRLQVETAYSTLLSSLENVQTATVALQQARESLRLARLRFQAGVDTQTNVITNEDRLTQAEGDRVRAILDYNRALVDLQRAVSGQNPR